MGFIDSIIQGIKDNLKWRVRGEAIRGVEKGIGSIIKKAKDRCPKCGKPITEVGARFCPNCRAKLILVCSNPFCQRESPLGTKFCPFCGAKMTKTKKSPETKSPESQK